MNEDNNNIEKHLIRIRDNIGMIWLTLVVYIVYIEFFKG